MNFFLHVFFKYFSLAVGDGVNDVNYVINVSTFIYLRNCPSLVIKTKEKQKRNKMLKNARNQIQKKENEEKRIKNELLRFKKRIKNELLRFKKRTSKKK